MLKIQYFFGGVGTISINPIKNVCRYTVVSIKEINNFIIPHFIKYPLQSCKLIDFDLWSQVITLLNEKKHLTSHRAPPRWRTPLRRGWMGEGFADAHPSPRPYL